MSQHIPTPAPGDEPDYAQHLIWRLIGSTITQFGSNEAGEIYLKTSKGDEIIIGKDEAGEITLFEIEKVAEQVR